LQACKHCVHLAALASGSMSDNAGLLITAMCTIPAARLGVKILISDLKIEPFSKKKKIQKLKNEIPTVKRQYAQ
jgi:hypothetical protein